jgi:trehalose synthase
MLNPVTITPKSLEDYRAIVGDQLIEEILNLAAPVRGARLIHINSTAFGGGVAEMLTTLVPLMNDIGLETEWQVIRGDAKFFEVTKTMHNSLQGTGIQIPWSQYMGRVWLHYNQINADLFDQDYDFVIIHDPQPAGILKMVLQSSNRARHGKWLWRCHIDLAESREDVWQFLRPFVEIYDGLIFTLEDYVKGGLGASHIFILPPAIDPLSPKNVELSPEVIAQALSPYGVNLNHPLIVQVSRLDRAKNPWGVIDAYRLVKREVPWVQLALVASMAHDDPDTRKYFQRIADYAGGDCDVYLLTNLVGVGNVEVNAFQRVAAVVVQNSVREGFGLSVSEALWKERPVVAGNVGGIPLQIIYGKTGYLVNTVQECANRIVYLLQHPQVAERMGRAGKEYVRQNFLVTRYLRDYLKILNRLSGQVESIEEGLEHRPS